MIITPTTIAAIFKPFHLLFTKSLFPFYEGKVNKSFYSKIDLGTLISLLQSEHFTFTNLFSDFSEVLSNSPLHGGSPLLSPLTEQASPENIFPCAPGMLGFQTLCLHSYSACPGLVIVVSFSLGIFDFCTQFSRLRYSFKFVG